MLNKIVLATHNNHKLQEVRDILSPLGIEVLGADDVGLTDSPETGTTFEENALQKARSAYQQIQVPVMADDTGLCISALNGAPGLFSARFAKQFGGYPTVFDEIWRQMGSNPDRSANFTCCIALITGPNKTDEHIFIGQMFGKIDSKASGTNLFGYDPIFIPDGYSDSCGVLGPEIKNRISHRAKALEKLCDFLKQS
jgi:XTP/dITP diphosphohydrolase